MTAAQPKPRMTGPQFTAWRIFMNFAEGESASKQAAADELEINVSSVYLYERGYRYGKDKRAYPVPRTVELACAALAEGITGYSGPG